MRYNKRSVVDAAHPDRFAKWVRDLYQKNGVYVIFEGAQCVYVGASTGDSLYGTLTRHFQRWERSQDKRPTGAVFERNRVKVYAEIIDNKDDALYREQELIHELNPRDNKQSSWLVINEPPAAKARGDDRQEGDAFDEVSAFFEDLVD